MINRLMHYIRLAGAYGVQFLFRLFPLDLKLIVFYAHKRKGLCCNPKYIMQYMLEKYPQDYKYCWVSEYPDTVPVNSGYKVVRKRSFKYYQILSRAKIFITNDMVDETLLKRKGQIYLCTWHGGGAYKKVGFDVKEAKENRQVEKTLKKWYGKLDYLILSNGFLQKEYESSFRMKKDQMLKTGMPRSDIFFHNNNLYLKIRNLYHLSEDIKILLYAPTFRCGKYDLLSGEELERILASLEKRFGGKWVCFYRTHYMDQEDRCIEYKERILNGNSYADAQEFLCAVDVLITDYSSLLWDFTLLKRPCFCYAKDLKNYLANERDFYLPYEEWPYPKAKSVSELNKEILEFDEVNYKGLLEQYIDKLDSYETGNSTEALVNILFYVIKNLKEGKWNVE